jgi:hypothetical protein
MALKYSKEQYLAWRLRIRELADGVLYRKEIAALVGCHEGYVMKVLTQERHLPRQKQYAPIGKYNPAWKHGRVIQRCGRVLAPAPIGHPLSRAYAHHKIGRILEHRLVMEKSLGRYLTKEEVVDHVDECVLHNDIKNLRLFSNNREHLQATIAGRKKDISAHGIEKIRSPRAGRSPELINNHRAMWQCGDVRLLQILHAWLLLDKDSPYLLGTHRYLEKSKIYYSDRRKISDNVISLCQKWELNQKLSRLEHLL